MAFNKRDISNLTDLERLVDLFYSKLLGYPEMAGFFQHTDWEHHKPVMVRFWENMLFFTGSYVGNPMEVHQKVHHKHSMSSEHFKIWQQCFRASVEELFEGEKADLAKSRAESIATVMQLKILS